MRASGDCCGYIAWHYARWEWSPWQLTREKVSALESDMGVNQSDQEGAFTKPRSRLVAAGQNAIRDMIAGFVAAIVLIGNIISFGALMFPGDLHLGIPIVVWSMLIGGCVAGVWIAWATSLPPLATGIDSPTGAVLVLLSAATATSVVEAGGGSETAVHTVMLIFTAATVLSGALFYVIGVCRWGSYFRFVPYFVVGGLLAATGCFLIAGAVRMTTSRAIFTLGGLAGHWTAGEIARVAISICVLAVLLILRRLIKSAFVVPGSLVVM